MATYIFTAILRPGDTTYEYTVSYDDNRHKTQIHTIETKPGVPAEKEHVLTHFDEDLPDALKLIFTHQQNVV
ncbi:MAG: hypothetical protein ACR2O0_04975 [Rhizobiaceae bacterium]